MQSSYQLITPNLPQSRFVVEAMVAKAAEVSGLTVDESFLLAQACGEVHGFLSQGPEDSQLDWRVLGGRSYAEAQVWLPARPRTWQALQACQLSGMLRDHTRERLLPAAGLKPGQTSLMRAARAVERVSLRAEERRVGLCLRKEHGYPDWEGEPLAPAPSQPPQRLDVPTLAGLQEFCSRLRLDQPEAPGWLSHPQRLADLLACEELQGVLAYGLQDRVLGAMFWRFRNRIVDGLGPYLLQGQSKELAESLLNHCLKAIGRTPAVGLSVSYITPALPVDQFELLGKVRELVSRKFREVPIYFRQLHEDPGGFVWSTPELEPWLREQYQALALAREIRLLGPASAVQSPYSAFSTQASGERSRLVLRPIHTGQDFSDNLQRYLAAAREIACPNVFLEMELSQSWQVSLAQDLQALNFRPCYVRPLGGEGLDLLIWQHDLEHS